MVEALDEIDPLVEFMPGTFPPDAWIADTTVRLSGDDNRNFDELFAPCETAHLEMMDDGTIWMEFIVPGGDRVVVIATAEKRGRMRVKVEVNP